jgi:hypothetical protein
MCCGDAGIGGVLWLLGSAHKAHPECRFERGSYQQASGSRSGARDVKPERGKQAADGDHMTLLHIYSFRLDDRKDATS